MAQFGTFLVICMGMLLLYVWFNFDDLRSEQAYRQMWYLNHKFKKLITKKKETMEVKFRQDLLNNLKKPPASMSGVVFGTGFSDHMFCMEWEEGEKGWHNGEIKPYGPLLLEPSSMVLHYAKCLLKGLKAYQTEFPGEHVLFRPEKILNV
ncbi:MAG: hypothetical protein Ct9H300mP21_10790 [Pseudomonadota bacterium]|nr:MAG: hypothetical protein Ct9H300mP21_10790 [Pseudomonadota bacterium]